MPRPLPCRHLGDGTTQVTGRSNSPFFAPVRKHSHSWELKRWGVLLRSLESRTATPPLGRCAISTQPAALLALLLNQCRPVRSVSIPPLLSFVCGFHCVRLHSIDVLV